MFKRLRSIIQKIRCSIPFGFSTFRHRNLKVIRKLSSQCELIQCLDCKRRFAINHSAEIVLPWEDVRSFYEEFDELFKELD